MTAIAAVMPGAAAQARPASRSVVPVTPIRHIVVLMQENHTFDSELGGWCNDPANAGRCLVNGVNTGEPASVTLSDGTVVVPKVASTIVAPVFHNIGSQMQAIDGGKMDGWQKISPGCLASTGYACISYYPATAVPNTASLASRFTVLDRAFTQADAPSFGGHLELIAGTTDGFTGDVPNWLPGAVHGSKDYGCDSGQVASMTGGMGLQPACIPDFNLDPALYPYGGAFEPTKVRNVPTVLDQMTMAGVSWGIYGAKPADAGGAYWSACPLAASCLDTAEFSNVHELGQFPADAAAGSLPAVSFVFPEGAYNGTNGGVYSQHNGESNVLGDNFIGQVAGDVMNSPDWSSTALIVTWDDCGCFYDSVAPPRGPDNRQMGPRVPFLLISPYALPAHTDESATSSTGSILRFIEDAFGLPYLTANVSGAASLMTDLNFAQAPLGRPRMVWRHVPQSAYVLSPEVASDGT